MWKQILDFCKNVHVEPPICPRVREAPIRFRSGSHCHQFSSAEEYYRAQYFSFLDAAATQLDERFNQMDFAK